MSKFKFSICGGTFDLLHEGHKSFIKTVVLNSEKTLLGITGNSYVKKNKNNILIDDYKIRRKNIENFLKENNFLQNVKIVEINSPYEPYLEKDTRYDAIFVTSNTKKAALEINKQRLKNKIHPLKIITVKIKNGPSGKDISSTRIRKGEIKRNGQPFIKDEWFIKNLVLPDNLRVFFQQPWGKVLRSVPKNIESRKTIVVGDATVYQFNKKQKHQFLSIVDLLINRQKAYENVSQLRFDKAKIYQISNPPGKVTGRLFKTLNKIFKNNSVLPNIILIKGEDDLAVLAVLLSAPLGFNIYYGQPGLGIIKINLTEVVKDKAYKLANKFIVE